MKPLRLNKVIGLAIGESSLLAAEVVAAGDGVPEVRKVAEFRYPEGITPAQPAELGAALATFLKAEDFSARNAVVGLPVRWLVVKPKAVPPADPATLAEMLRLQAEGEFSSELKDLVYDYAADATAGQPTSVLLIATPKKYVDGAVALCDAAKLTAAAVTPSAVALGAATAAGADLGSSIVMAVGPGGAELTAQAGSAPAAIRHLRGPATGDAADNKPFLGELRRAVSTLPAAADGSARKMILWGTGADAAAVGDSLGIPVRSGDLPGLGVNVNGADTQGDGRRFAAAVALALSAMGAGSRSVDFLHTRLAPPKVARIPRWAVWAVLVGVAVIAGAVEGNSYLQDRQATLDKLTKQVDGQKDAEAHADAFVKMVSFAKRWHGGDPRYLACLRDLAVALPQDGQMYATNLTLHEPTRPTGAAAAAQAKPDDDVLLVGRLEGVTSDQVRAQQVVDRLKALPAFQNVRPGGFTNKVTNRVTEVAFSVTFDYLPPKPTAAPPAASQHH